ncbi:hypothetical protein DACRYDRAFT_15931 [Dacryopinax primogenitus]|uniref:Uncharacterized protein n=1 Tax=Dacryopinax primogenitus (strain DJM 731) TaxID=1858805 RepID=M5GCU3_DACPD|nr:uncharacterized protein DACRYDRAFT_15931 [Dacryopinax primogenitus]EJU01973.1 hypothetical protein DACRYDRAFT_15931 [Dacryopinax primogenitus]
MHAVGTSALDVYAPLPPVIPADNLAERRIPASNRGRGGGRGRGVKSAPASRKTNSRRDPPEGPEENPSLSTRAGKQPVPQNDDSFDSPFTNNVERADPQPSILPPVGQTQPQPSRANERRPGRKFITRPMSKSASPAPSLVRPAPFPMSLSVNVPDNLQPRPRPRPLFASSAVPSVPMAEPTKTDLGRKRAASPDREIEVPPKRIRMPTIAEEARRAAPSRLGQPPASSHTQQEAPSVSSSQQPSQPPLSVKQEEGDIKILDVDGTELVAQVDPHSQVTIQKIAHLKIRLMEILGMPSYDKIFSTLNAFERDIMNPQTQA